MAMMGLLQQKRTIVQKLRKGKRMQEVKQPNKKPFIFYYLIALVAIMLINSLLVPQIA